MEKKEKEKKKKPIPSVGFHAAEKKTLQQQKKTPEGAVMRLAWMPLNEDIDRADQLTG